MHISFNISSTGAAYFLLFLALAFLTYRFFQYWQKSKDTTSKAFVFFALSLALLAFIRAISGLFFYSNVRILAISITLVSFFQALAAAIGIFIVFHLKFPKIFPWLVFLFVFVLGIFSTVSTYFVSFSRIITIEAFGAINWGTTGQGFGYALLRMTILALAFIPVIIIFIQQGKTASDSRLRKRCFGLAAALLIGVAIGVLDFFFIELLGFKAISRDIVAGILSIVLFFIILMTQKAPSENDKN
jgi:hypothetical protein